jgi:hypothetical protein
MIVSESIERYCISVFIDKLNREFLNQLNIYCISVFIGKLNRVSESIGLCYM